MGTSMKLKIFAGISAFAVIAGFFLWQSLPVKANPSSVSVYTNATSTTNSTATTTAQAPFFRSSTATSSIAFDPQNGNLIQVALSAYSTSTPTIVHYGLEFSNNNIDR